MSPHDHCTMRNVCIFTSCILLFSLAMAGCGQADPTDVIDALEANFQQNMEGVETFTVYAAGMEIHHRLNTSDSLTAFDLGVTQSDSTRSIPTSANLIPFLVPDVPKLVRGLRSGAHLLDNETFNGQNVYVIEADNPASLIVGGAGPMNDISAARVYVDADTYELRGVTMEMLPPDTSLTEMIVQQVRYELFRDVEGLTLPFKVTTMTEGLKQLIPDELRIVENGNLTIARSQAQQLPPGEREVELASIAARERFLNEGIQEDVLTVDSVHVNADIPPGVFGAVGE